MDLSIIILSFNTSKLLKKCLESIYSYLQSKKIEIIVVDNNSQDDSVEMMENKFPLVKIIKSKTNLGFAKGINIGVKKAKADYLLLLNSDTYLQDSSILNMLDFMIHNTNAAICGGLMKDSDGKLQRSYGKFYGLINSIKMLTFGDEAEIENYNELKIKKIDWVSGGFMMVKRNIFQELNGFDENFFMYIEDMEFCYRAHKKGKFSFIYPHASIVHLSQGSSNRSFAIENIYKGLLYFFKKHKGRPEYLILKLFLRMKAVILIISGIVFANSYLKNTYIKALRY